MSTDSVLVYARNKNQQRQQHDSRDSTNYTLGGHYNFYSKIFQNILTGVCVMNDELMMMITCKAKAVGDWRASHMVKIIASIRSIRCMQCSHCLTRVGGEINIVV